MKIGILTFHNTTNFGSMLQTYGLYKAIENLGQEPEIINYNCKFLEDKEIPKNIRLHLKLKENIKEILIYNKIRKKYKKLTLFLKNNVKLSKPYNVNNIKDSSNKYDKFFVGSDIVWGLDITSNDYTYFLNFIKNKNKKYSFSSSIGNKWKENQKIEVKKLLTDFKQIAVREIEAKKWVDELVKGKVDVVCDPTMLIKNEWNKFIIEEDKNEKYVLVYFNDSNNKCLESAMRYAARNNLKIYYINYSLPLSKVKNIKPESIEEFLTLIYNAEFISTASYHGLLFSLYFNKKFAYFNRAHKSRMDSLGKMLSICDRDGIKNDILKMGELNYDEINKKIDIIKEKSLDILKGMLDE